MRGTLPVLAGLVLLAYGLAASGAAPVAPTSPPVSFEPTYYGCRGNGISAVYRVAGLDGKGALSLKISGKSYEFKGDEITSVSLALGEVKEAVLEIRPDIGSTSATLILPRINLVKKSALLFQTQLAITRTSMPFIRIPPDGLVTATISYPLVCIAKKAADTSYEELFP
jgi:hypothetical protein